MEGFPANAQIFKYSIIRKNALKGRFWIYSQNRSILLFRMELLHNYHPIQLTDLLLYLIPEMP